MVNIPQKWLWLFQVLAEAEEGTNRRIIAHSCGYHSLVQPTGKVEFKKQRYLSTSKTSIYWWKCSEFGRKSLHGNLCILWIKNMSVTTVTLQCTRLSLPRLDLGLRLFLLHCLQPLRSPLNSLWIRLACERWDASPQWLRMLRFSTWWRECGSGSARGRIERVLMDSEQFMYLKYCFAFCVHIKNIKILCSGALHNHPRFCQSAIKGAERDQEMVVQSLIMDKHQLKSSLATLFQKMDDDQSGKNGTFFHCKDLSLRVRWREF